MKSAPSPDSRGHRRGRPDQFVQPPDTVVVPYDADEKYRSRLNTVLERQARAIGQSLHDEAGQMLAAAFLALDEAARDLPAPAQERLGVVKTHLTAVEEQLRHVAQELHPRVLSESGIVAALEFLARGFAARHGVITTVSARVPRRLPEAVATAVYRMAQEGLTNIGRHAQATHASIQVGAKAGVVTCTISDDGIGFEPALARRGGIGLGLQGIDERLALLGGVLLVRSHRGAGTALVAEIPLEQ